MRSLPYFLTFTHLRNRKISLFCSLSFLYHSCILPLYKIRIANRQDDAIRKMYGWTTSFFFFFFFPFSNHISLRIYLFTDFGGVGIEGWRGGADLTGRFGEIGKVRTYFLGPYMWPAHLHGGSVLVGHVFHTYIAFSHSHIYNSFNIYTNIYLASFLLAPLLLPVFSFFFLFFSLSCVFQASNNCLILPKNVTNFAIVHTYLPTYQRGQPPSPPHSSICHAVYDK